MRVNIPNNSSLCSSAFLFWMEIFLKWFIHYDSFWGEVTGYKLFLMTRCHYYNYLLHWCDYQLESSVFKWFSLPTPPLIHPSLKACRSWLPAAFPHVYLLEQWFSTPGWLALPGKFVSNADIRISLKRCCRSGVRLRTSQFSQAPQGYAGGLRTTQWEMLCYGLRTKWFNHLCIQQRLSRLSTRVKTLTSLCRRSTV